MKKAKPKPKQAKPKRQASAATTDLAAKTFMKLEGIKKRLIPPFMYQGMTDEDMVRLTQEQRADGRLGPDEFFFFAATWLTRIGEDRVFKDADLARISADIGKLEKKHGLKKGEYWPLGEAPDDVENLRTKWDQLADQIIADVMRAHGEDALADSYLADKDAFFKRLDKCRKKIMGVSIADIKAGNTGS